MSFAKRLQKALGGEDPRVADDVEREAAEELRRVRGPAAGPGGAGPSAPGMKPPSGPPGAPGAGTPGAPGASKPAAPSSPATGSGASGGGSPAPSPGAMSSAPEAPGPPPTAPGSAPTSFTAPSSGEAATPEEERQALNEMALEDLGGTAAEGGLRVDPAQAEAMRDRALAQYMQRKEEFDRFRQEQAERGGQGETQQSGGQSRGGAQPERAQQARLSAAQRWAHNSDEEDPELDELQQRLGDLPGMTRTKMEALLNEFDSIEALEQAGEDDVVQVDGIGQRLAAKIVKGLQ